MKYTYRAETAPLPLLKDLKGANYLPLLEAADFYGIRMEFDSLTRRVVLSKGTNRARFVLSQPVFLTGEPEASFAMEPAEMVSGRIGIPPESLPEILAAILAINVRYLGEEKTLLAGGVREEDLRQEVLAEARKEPKPAPPPAGKTPAPTAAPKAEPKRPGTTPSAGQVYQVRKVVLDAGHGGHDSGARGYFKGYVEKQAALDITLKVRDFLREKGFEVILTRDKDEFVTLENRTQVANRNKADLFVSIHCNANRKSSVTGTEIYTYNSKASNKLAAMSALRENAGGDYTDFILADLHHQGYVERSQFLAEKLAVRIREGLKQHYRSTQRGPFYVLGKADMPAVLVETAYISNKTEHAKIRDPYWRKKIAKAIADGIVEYREKVEKTLENHQARR